MKYWDDIFYIINLDTREMVGRYSSYEDAKETILLLEERGNFELVHAIDYR